MNILYSSQTSLAGVCELMARCVNKYYGDVHEARVLNKGPKRHRWYTREGENCPKRYRYGKDNNEALAWADVIHCMANVSAKTMNRLDLLKKKVWVFQWHGAQIWPFDRVWDREHLKHVRWIHIGQGWPERQWDFFKPFFKDLGCKVVPNIISIDDPIHVPIEDRTTKVGFAPSTLRKNAPNPKGVDEVKEHCRGYKLDMISGLAFEECMRRKQMCELGIDEIVTSSYHRSGLEFLSQGVPCVCSYNEDSERALKDATGASSMPFINCKTPSHLKNQLKWYFGHLLDDERHEMRKAARRWMEDFYHPRDLLKRHFEVYE